MVLFADIALELLKELSESLCRLYSTLLNFESLLQIAVQQEDPVMTHSLADVLRCCFSMYLMMPLKKKKSAPVALSSKTHLQSTNAAATMLHTWHGALQMKSLRLFFFSHTKD